MSSNSSASSLKYIPVYSLKKSLKYVQNINKGRKKGRSVCYLFAIWCGLVFGVCFPLFIWHDARATASEWFYVDPNWFVSLMVLLVSMSFFSNVFYFIMKAVFWVYNYYLYGSISFIERPISDTTISKITGCVITSGNQTFTLHSTQVLRIHRELLIVLRNKKDKPRIKHAFEKFLEGNVMSAMVESPLVAQIIAKSFSSTPAISEEIFNKYTGISMVSDAVPNPAESHIQGRLGRLARKVDEIQAELSEMVMILEDHEFRDPNSVRSSIELQSYGLNSVA